MIFLLSLLLCANACCIQTTSLASQASVSDKLPWSERLALSEMIRRGDSLSLEKNPKAKWAYETGVFLKGIEGVWSKKGNEKYFEYLKSTVDSFIEPDGSIRTYKLEDYNLDNINTGKVALSLYQKTKDERYKKAAFLLMKQLETQPRTNEGGFWHKKIYPYQMWLDGIYMEAPFYAQFSQMFDRPAGFDDVARQIIFIESHTRDPKTGLLYHGWDESKKEEWADPKTGCSKSFWGRSIGWYAMGIVDVLDFMPPDHPKREALISIFQSVCKAVAKYQDNETGLWYQVLDQGKRPGNYLEASASSMFIYALAKGIRKGYLGKEYLGTARKAHDGIVRHLIKVDPDGLVSLTQICSVAGLGGPQRRNGTFDYYIGEPVVANDLKGVGSFILASLEMEALLAPN